MWSSERRCLQSLFAVPELNDFFFTCAITLKILTVVILSVKWDTVTLTIKVKSSERQMTEHLHPLQHLKCRTNINTYILQIYTRVNFSRYMKKPTLSFRIQFCLGIISLPSHKERSF